MKRFKLMAAVCFVVGVLGPLSSHAGIITTGLIGYWIGDGNANDSSSIGNDGSFSGTYAAGTHGQQAFDIGSGSVSIPNNSAYQIGADFSVNLLFNLNGTSSSSVGFIGQDQGPGNLPKWFIDYNYANTNAFEFHVNNYGASPKAFLPSDPLALSSQWYDLTVVKSGSLYTFYLDGVSIGSDTLSAVIPTISAPLTIGPAEPVLQFGGLIQDVSLYNIALSQSQIDTLNTFGTPRPPLPEPETLSLIAIGVGPLALSLRKRRIKSES